MFTPRHFQNYTSLMFGQYSIEWKNKKKLVSKIFQKVFDLGSENAVSIFEKELQYTLNNMKALQGIYFDPKLSIEKLVGGILFQMLYGQTDHVQTDEIFIKYLSAFKEMQCYTQQKVHHVNFT